MKTPAPSGRTQPLWFIDNLVYVHIDGDASSGALALLDERGRRGNMPPLHVHRRDDETFYVLEGELTLFVAGEQIVLGPGQVGARPARRAARLPRRVRGGPLVGDHHARRLRRLRARGL
jgi:mannose-6-phosphate isomerase-like protein (cupin superfamily)